MMGFLPGLPYLGGLPPEFALPRRENPRMKVPQRLGRRRHGHDGRSIRWRAPAAGTSSRARRPRCGTCGATPPALLAAGDKVTFAPVSLREYERLSAKAAAGELRLAPDEPPTREPRA